MSVFTRGVISAAASSPNYLVAGTPDSPITLSWNEVHERAKQIASGLSAQGLGPHGCVAVLATDAADVVPLTQAIWLRRASLTMLQLPTPRTDMAVWLADSVRAIRMIKADLVVVAEPFLPVLQRLHDHDLAACTVDSLRSAASSGLAALDQPDEPDETDVALRQLTSGSTGMPKAVEISHANLAAHTAALRERLQVDVDADVALSWLPLSHDMGMIGFVCLPMALGLESVIVPPQQFVARPLVWAELISAYRATITSGPNFAYSVLARVLRRAEPTRIDLSSLRIAINGAEPIDHRDLADFAAVGARFGLRPTATMPAYGLAEATLAVSLGAPDDQPVVDRVSRHALTEDHRAEPAGDDPQDARPLVCLGLPVAGLDLRISRGGTSAAPREVGAIELRGAAVAQSYLTTDGVVPLAGDDGWFDTGDLGYLDERGRVYVCGRAKDLIVLAGRNLYPHDIERAAESVDGVRKGGVIALRIDGEPEGFAVLAEVGCADGQQSRARIIREVTAAVSRRVGHLPREVQLFCAGSLPKTPSGKLRRGNARQLLQK